MEKVFESYKISIIWVILSLQNFLTLSPTVPSPQFFTSDCYESFSYPKMYLELLNNYKRGPSLLFSNFSFIISSYIYGFSSKTIFSYNFFKRSNSSCPSSIIITTKGIPIIEINLIIKIRTYIFKYLISDIIYKIHDGFKQGNHTLRDMNRRFGVKANIFKAGKEYITNYNTSKIPESLIFGSISDSDEDICLITENNIDVVIRPSYIDAKPKGLLTRIKVKHILNDQIINHINFTAFGCISYDENPNKENFFIDEEFQNLNTFNGQLKLNFTAVYVKFENNKKVIAQVPFNIPYIKIKDFSQHESIPFYFKKIFLTNEFEVLFCPDGTQRYLFTSYNGIPYHVIGSGRITVSPKITEYYWKSHSPLSPCDDL